MEGQTPASVFDACLEVKRVVPSAVREVMLWKPSPLTRVGRNGVRCGGFVYGARAHEMFAWQGKEVIVRVDPANVNRAAVCDPAGKFICMAACNERLPFKATREESRAANTSVKQHKKRVREYHRTKLAIHRDPAAEMFHQRAEEARRKREKNPPSAPAMQPVRTPMDNQLSALRRALDEDQLAMAAGAEGMAMGAGGPLKTFAELAEIFREDEPDAKPYEGSVLNQWNTLREREAREKEEREALEARTDPFEQQSRENAEDES